MGALVAARHDPEIKAFRDKLVALIAAARKLPPIFTAILRDGRSWTKEQAHAEASI